MISSDYDVYGICSQFLVLGQPPSLKVSNHIYIDSKAGWDEIAGSAKQHVELSLNLNP